MINRDKPKVYWITGLSGAGKSTLCRKLVDHLIRNNKQVIYLDGDELREIMGATDNYTVVERKKLSLRYAKLCKCLSEQGFNVAIATISLFHDTHDWNRSNLQGYVEIFLDVPISELKKRDSKSIYSRQKNATLNNVAGIDLKVEFPQNADIVIKYHEGQNADSVFNMLLQELEKID
jgi:adenylylsulfate kinase-like enzyme